MSDTEGGKPIWVGSHGEYTDAHTGNKAENSAQNSEEVWRKILRGVDEARNIYRHIVNPVSIVDRAIHYSRNIFNKTYETIDDLPANAVKLGEDEDKFHQHNQADDRNSKYVVGNWGSSEVVYYSDGTLNNTPEDQGTFNVYYGPSKFLNYTVHALLDVVPYMLWGNSFSDSTTFGERILDMFR